MQIFGTNEKNTHKIWQLIIECLANWKKLKRNLLFLTLIWKFSLRILCYSMLRLVHCSWNALAFIALLCQLNFIHFVFSPFIVDCTIYTSISIWNTNYCEQIKNYINQINMVKKKINKGKFFYIYSKHRISCFSFIQK